MKLTRGQRDALVVLFVTDRLVPGGKRRSRLEPVPHVNSRAADSLFDMGLARRSIIPYASVFSTGWEYRITDEGIRVAEGLA